MGEWGPAIRMAMETVAPFRSLPTSLNISYPTTIAIWRGFQVYLERLLCLWYIWRDFHACGIFREIVVLAIYLERLLRLRYIQRDCCACGISREIVVRVVY